MFDVHAALRTLVSKGGSDLHLKVDAPPLYRINGSLAPLEGEAPLDDADTEAAFSGVVPDELKQQEFDDENEADFSFEMPGVSRFRVNAFRQRGRISLAFRAIPTAIRSIDDLQLPPVVRELAEEERGIILLTGTTGSGKSTTLAAMIDHINSTMAKHVVTIEDPIEYVHPDKRSAINQREVGMDTATFGRAMRRVLRQDPDVILIGEMRDEETVRAALSAAETGHLVMSTVHTLDAAESINRILDFFPPHQHSQARSMIAGTLRGVISQRLVRSVDGGRVAVCEILRMTGRVHDMIKDPEQMGKLGDVIFTGGYYGMQTFDQALFKHVKAKRVTFEDAMRVASSPHDFKLLVEADGKRGTTMEDVAEAQEQAQRRAGGSTAPASSGVAPATGAPAAPAAAGLSNGAGTNGSAAGTDSGLSNGAGTTETAPGLSNGAGTTETAPGLSNGASTGLSSGVSVSAGATADATSGVSNGAPGVSSGAAPSSGPATGTPGSTSAPPSSGLSAGASPPPPPPAAVSSPPPPPPSSATIVAGTPPPPPSLPPAPDPSVAEKGLSAGAAPTAPTASADAPADANAASTAANAGATAAPAGVAPMAPPSTAPASAPTDAGLTPGVGLVGDPAKTEADAAASATGDAAASPPAASDPTDSSADAGADSGLTPGAAPAQSAETASASETAALSPGVAP